MEPIIIPHNSYIIGSSQRKSGNLVEITVDLYCDGAGLPERTTHVFGWAGVVPDLWTEKYDPAHKWESQLPYQKVEAKNSRITHRFQVEIPEEFSVWTAEYEFFAFPFSVNGQRFVPTPHKIRSITTGSNYFKNS